MNAIVGWMGGVLDWLKMGVGLLLWVWVLVVLPMLIFRRTRKYGAVVLLYSSMLTAFSCWWFCFILCYRALGLFWLIVGVVLLGFGVIPVAFIGLMIKSFWTPGLGAWVLDVFGAIMLFAVPRWLALFILQRCEKREAEEASKQAVA